MEVSKREKQQSKEIKKENEQQKKKINELAELNKKLQQELQIQQKSHEGIIEQIHSNLNDNQYESQHLSEKNTLLKDEVDQLKKQLRQSNLLHQKLITEKEKEIDYLKRNLDDIDQKCLELNSTLIKKDEFIKKKCEQNKRYSKQIEDLKSNNIELLNDNDKMAEDLKRYQTQFNFEHDKSAEIEQLQIELHNKEQDIYNLTDELNLSKQQFDKLNSDFDQITTENSQLTNEIKLLNEKTKAITQRLEIIQKHQSQPESISGIEASYNARIERMKYEYESKIEALKSKVMKYKNQLKQQIISSTPSIPSPPHNNIPTITTASLPPSTTINITSNSPLLHPYQPISRYNNNNQQQQRQMMMNDNNNLSTSIADLSTNTTTTTTTTSTSSPLMMLYDKPPVMPPKPSPAKIYQYQSNQHQNHHHQKQQQLNNNYSPDPSLNYYSTNSPIDSSMSDHSSDNMTIDSDIPSYTNNKYPDYEELMKKYKGSKH